MIYQRAAFSLSFLLIVFVNSAHLWLLPPFFALQCFSCLISYLRISPLFHNFSYLSLPFFNFPSYRFEKLDITPKSAQKIKPVLERWMAEAEERYKNGVQNLTDFIGSEPSKKRKRRTSFTPQALELLNQYFERNTHPTGKCKKQLICIYPFFLKL